MWRLVSFGFVVSTAAFAALGCSASFSAGASTSGQGGGVSANTHAGAEPPPDPAPRATAEASAEASVKVEFFSIPLDGAQDVVFVLDRSGSMSGPAVGLSGEGMGMSKTGAVLASIGATLANEAAGDPVPTKLEATQAELVDALRDLPDGTRVGVIFFGSSTATMSDELIPLDADRRNEAEGFIAGIDPSGSTAAVPALEQAYAMGARRVVLLSDGLANEGGDADTLLSQARTQIADGVRFDTVGAGLDQDADLLRKLAAESGGQSVIR